MIFEKLFHTATEAAAILNVSTQTVYGLLESGKLRGFKDNPYSSWKITEEAIGDYARQREAEGLEKMRIYQEKMRINGRKKDSN